LIVNTSITWIRVEKPVFDLAGVILSSLGLTGVCVAVAVVLGCLWGAVLIRRTVRRRRADADDPVLTLRVTRT
jgi:positive regulator of sigma E activity